MIPYHSVRIDIFEDALEIANFLPKNMLILSFGDTIAEVENMFRQPPLVDC